MRLLLRLHSNTFVMTLPATHHPPQQHVWIEGDYFLIFFSSSFDTTLYRCWCYCHDKCMIDITRKCKWWRRGLLPLILLIITYNVMIYFIRIDVPHVHTHHPLSHSHPPTDMSSSSNARATAISNHSKWTEILGRRRSRWRSQDGRMSSLIIYQGGRVCTTLLRITMKLNSKPNWRIYNRPRFHSVSTNERKEEREEK